MKKLILLALALHAAPASAEWIRVTKSVEGNVTYMDRETRTHQVSGA